jgi:uncharacterized protein YjiK
MQNFISNIFIVLTFALSSCDASYINNEKITGYNLTTPDVKFILPDTLHEISGLTNIDSATFACVQDENGIVFIYDAMQNEIKKQFVFGADGDYEGITLVNKTIYVLRSDGYLFEISDYESEEFILTSFSTDIPAKDNEGLCYDTDNNRLLIACKSKIRNGTKSKDNRAIYGFDLKTKTLTQKPIFNFDIKIIKQFAIDNKISLPTKKKKGNQINEPSFKFRPSAIGIHPFTKQLYIISSSDHLLFIFDMNGDIKHIEQLNPFMFNQAEGITFFENGDMLISNEGKDKKPTLLRFNYRKE